MYWLVPSLDHTTPEPQKNQISKILADVLIQKYLPSLVGIISNCLQPLVEKQQYYPKGKSHKQEK